MKLLALLPTLLLAGTSSVAAQMSSNDTDSSITAVLIDECPVELNACNNDDDCNSCLGLLESEGRRLVDDTDAYTFAACLSITSIQGFFAQIDTCGLNAALGDMLSCSVQAFGCEDSTCGPELLGCVSDEDCSTCLLFFGLDSDDSDTDTDSTTDSTSLSLLSCDNLAQASRVLGDIDCGAATFTDFTDCIEQAADECDGAFATSSVGLVTLALSCAAAAAALL